MTELTNTFFKINDADIIRKTSQVKQLVDILQVDVASVDDDDAPSSSNNTKTRKKYEVFVSGTGANAVTSSLFQTIFDQDYTTQTSNELFDIAIGCYDGSKLVSDASTGTDSSGKRLFPNTVLMMREKINIYKQYAQTLLGDSSSFFTSPYESTVSSGDNPPERIDEAIFLNVKRLFARDSIVKEQFTMKLYKNPGAGTNIGTPADSASSITITDSGASTSLRVTSQAGSIGTLVEGANNVGLIFYEKGIVVLDAKKVFNGTVNVKGNIPTVSGGNDTAFDDKLFPNLWATGSIDTIVDHICNTRFGRTTSTAMGFLNQTNINSSIYVCRVAPSQANYSRNPTYTNSDGTIRVIDGLDNRGADPFSYITTIGLYDTSNNLLAVAKTSRPIEKNPEVDLSISVRIDY
jgi:hypothetical protein